MGRRAGSVMLAGFLGALIGGPPVRAEDAVSAGAQSPAFSLPSERSGDPAGAADSGEPMRLSMDFQDANLKDVLKIFAQQTGINVIASAGISSMPVTLYLQDVKALDALDQILAAANLTYERAPESDIYVVTAKGPEATRTITRVYRLKYARVSQSTLAMAATAFAAKTPFEATLGAAGSSGGGGGSSSSGGGSSSSGGGSASGGGGQTQFIPVPSALGPGARDSLSQQAQWR